MRSLPSSRYLRFLTFFMVGFPALYLGFASFVFDVSGENVLKIISSPLFSICMVLWIATGRGLRNTRKWSWYTFGAAQLFTLYLNAVVLGNYSVSPTKWWAFLLIVLVQIYVYIIASREMRVPYLFPKIRWWESGIAGMSHIGIDLESKDESKKTGQILDISLRGCFVKCPQEFKEFERVKIKGTAFGVALEVSGVVVWNAESTVTHPKGIGVKFYGLDKTQKRRLSAVATRFTKERDHPRAIKRAV